MHGDITDVAGIAVGHADDDIDLTGCTAVIAAGGAVGGVDVRGGAPGTRETDLLRPGNLVERVHAVLVSGGSAFGLDAASGVMRFLEERGVGFQAGSQRVPIVCSAVIFDLDLGDPRVRPDAEMGYRAAEAAGSGPIRQGNAGAGMGATVGKAFGSRWAMKGGVGSSSLEIRGGVRVGALVVVNSFGDVLDPQTGKIIAGARDPGTGTPAGTVSCLLGGRAMNAAAFNTTVAIVATDAKLSKEQANRVAMVAQDGLARCIDPVHTLYDGDTVFCLALGDKDCDVNLVGIAASRCVEHAILRAVMSAEPAGGIPAVAKPS